MGHEKHRDIHACLTAWAVRRAGPERRSVGYLPHCGWAISSRKPFSTLAAFWDTGWAVGSLPEGNANKKCQHGVDWVLVFLTLVASVSPNTVGLALGPGDRVYAPLPGCPVYQILSSAQGGLGSAHCRSLGLLPLGGGPCRRARRGPQQELGSPLNLDLHSWLSIPFCSRGCPGEHTKLMVTLQRNSCATWGECEVTGLVQEGCLTFFPALFIVLLDHRHCRSKERGPGGPQSELGLQ